MLSSELYLNLDDIIFTTALAGKAYAGKPTYLHHNTPLSITILSYKILYIS